MLVGLLAVLMLSFELHPSATAEQPYVLVFRRNLTDDVVILMCRNGTTFPAINVEVNTNIQFYLNLTEGVRMGPAILEERISPAVLIRSGTAAYFFIRRELNGFYSCGTNETQQSNVKPLICKS